MRVFYAFPVFIPLLAHWSTLIERGKFGSVFRCENKQTHQILAMKEIKTDRLGRHTSGDIMEVAVLRAIGHHENIACLHSVYEVQHTCFIITE
ncbi:unnamed protein product [Rodentolepis nana]|uniref:Protein kinase domain-containing protein n=1 Tax=Rodentolepis nana TaxID=102285 RepID=A0A0R3TE62_RODNA|nr:unnamed protein product [Rodentolepis nana]